MPAPLSSKADLAGQTAVVTGGGGGIGAATCEALARDGANVVACDVDESLLERTVERVEDRGGTCVSVECDVTDESEVEAVRDVAVDAFGSVEILANVHGIVSRDSPTEESLDAWNRVVAVNLTGSFLTARTFFEHMVERGYGKIVSVGSVAGRTGRTRPSMAYSASKGGLHALTRSLAAQGASSGVFVNAVAPGPVRTPLTDMGASFETDAMPLGRAGEPADVAEAVAFLSSQQSNWVTGVVLDVNGGVYTG